MDNTKKNVRQRTMTQGDDAGTNAPVQRKGNKDGPTMRDDGLGHPIFFMRRRRYHVAVMAFLGYVAAYSTRINLSVAIIQMTKKSDRNDSSSSSSSSSPSSSPSSPSSLSSSPSSLSSSSSTNQENVFEWDEKTQGIVLASFFYGYLITQIPGGYLAGVIGGNHVMNIGVAGSALVSLVSPVCIKWHFAAAVAVRIICGLFQGVIIPSMNSMWARWAPPLETTILTTIAISGNFFSPLIILPLSGAIGESFGWEWTFYTFGLVSLVWCTIWWLGIFAGPEKDKCIRKSELDYIERCIGQRTNIKPVHPWKKLLSSCPVGACVISQVGHNWGFYVLLLYGPKFYHETLRYNISGATLFTGIAFAVNGILMQVVGHLSDSMRKRKVMKTGAIRKLFCCGGFAVQCTCMFVLVFVFSEPWCVALTILAIGLGGITWGGLNVNPLDIAPPHSAIILGIANTFATFPGIIAPSVCSLFLHEKVPPVMKDWMWIWVICGVIYVSSAILFCFMASGEKQPWVFSADSERRSESAS